MKTLFKVSALGILLAASSVLAFGQEDQGAKLQALYGQFRNEIKAKCGERGPALTTGRNIVTTFEPKQGETNQAVLDFYKLNKEVIEFVKKRVTVIEAEDPACVRDAAYIKAFQAKDWNSVFTTGEAIISAEPNSPKALDIKLDLASVGYDRAIEKNDAFNAKTLAHAKSALEGLNANKESNSKAFGAFVPNKTRENAQSWMNYIIGWMMYNKMNQQKDALTYFYKTSQVNGDKKNDTTIYTNIGRFYFDEAVRLDSEYRTKFKANNNEDNDETKALLALAKGTADRAADAFGRAYKIAAADPKLATLKTNVAKTLTELYKFRFNTTDAKQADVDKYVNDLVAKPMPDPATAVTPVIEATPTTTTTSTTPVSTTTTTLNATTAATTETTPVSKTTPATKTTKTTPAVKKPVVKKKGTR